MASKKTGLGRGFGSLIPEKLIDEQFDITAKQDKQISSLGEINIEDVYPNPDQPRKHFAKDALSELAQSIREHGVVQPIVVIADGNGKYMIVAGERRWRASIEAGKKLIPAVIRTFDNQERLEVALIENMQREDLTALEMATAIQKLNDQFNIKPEEIGKRVGKAATTIINIRRLLKLPDAAKRALNDGKISEKHARAILALGDDPRKQQELLDLILRHGWTSLRAEQFVVAYKTGATNSKEATQRTETQTVETKALSKKLKAPVRIHRMAKGGRLTIQFKNDKDYDRIITMLSELE